MSQEPNKELFKTVINRILADPESWDQERWHSDYGTSHCFAGHAQIAAGHKPDFLETHRQAQEALGVGEIFAEWLCDSRRTLPELYNAAKGVVSGDIDRHGHHSTGNLMDMPPL